MTLVTILPKKWMGENVHQGTSCEEASLMFQVPILVIAPLRCLYGMNYLHIPLKNIPSLFAWQAHLVQHLDCHHPHCP